MISRVNDISVHCGRVPRTRYIQGINAATTCIRGIYPIPKETRCAHEHSAFAIMQGCTVAPMLAAHPLAIADTVTLSSILPINAIVSARDFVALSRIVNSRSTYRNNLYISSVTAVIACVAPRWRFIID